MQQTNDKYWLLGTTVFAVLLTTVALSHFVTSPWHVIPGLGADSGKNIFTYLYQILYGKGYWFEGMNYPYGEHIVYTDGQPVLSVPLSYIKGYLSVGSALAIMFWLIGVSYVLCTVYLFKILRHFDVRPLLAMLFAGLITIFSPQIFRLSGHFALSYVCVIPMMFYWVLQYHTTQKKQYPIFIFLFACFCSFLHPYFAAVTLIFICLYSGWYMLTGKGSIIERVKYIVPLAASILLVFVVFGMVMKLTDPLTDRPTTPFGILANLAHIKDVVTSIHSPIWYPIKSNNVFKYVADPSEGTSYLGVVVILTICISAVFGLINLRKKKTVKNVVGAQKFQPIWILVAFSALLFSMGVPFIWKLEWLLDYASLLKQFRTLGRFAWIFYYTMCVYGVVVIDSWYSRLLQVQKKGLGILLLICTLGIWAWEGSWYVQMAHETARTGYNNYDEFASTKSQNWEQFLAEHHYNKDSFQAILVMRFFENGSEKLWLGHTDDISAWGVAMSIKAAIQLHLPIINCMMSRTSWSKAFAQVKISGGPFTNKPILNDIKNDKPFLMQVLDMEQADPNTRYLIAASDSIGHFLSCTVYACYPGRLRAIEHKLHGQVNDVLATFPVGDTCITAGSSAWFTNHFEGYKADSILSGNGAMASNGKERQVIGEFKVKPIKDNEEYEFSCWFLVPGDNYKSPYCVIEVLDSAGNVIGNTDALTKESTDNEGLWLRGSTFFKLQINAATVRCSLVDLPEKSYLVVDELMLKPIDAIIISKASNGQVMVNNHKYIK